MIDIVLTDGYRLTSDGAQFIVLERQIVDPTKAPNWERRVAEAAAKGETLDPTIREEWREIAFYGMRPDSLILALRFVVMRKAANSDATTIEEFAEIIHTESERISSAISSVMRTPELSEG